MPAKPSSWAWKLALSRRSANGERSQHLPAPADGLLLEPVERHDRVDEPHLQGFFGRVHPAEEPHLLGLLRSDEAGEDGGAEAAVEAADPGADLPELRVVCGDGEVADHVQDVASADGVSGHHRHHGLGATSDLDVEVRDVEAPDRRPARRSARVFGVFEVSRVTAYLLVATGAEGVGPFPGQDDNPRLVVLAGVFEGPLHLDHRNGRKALRTSGRFMVIFAIPSAFSYLMSSNSPADSQAIFVMPGII